MDQCKKQILVINTGGGGGGGGDGDVKGPAGANDLHVAVFNGVTGKKIADGGLAVADLQTRGIPSGGTPTHVTDIESMLDHMWSAGAVAGFALTDNGNGTVNIAAGEVMLRTSATDDGQLLSMTVPAVAGLALTDHATNYVCVDYNAGTPQIIVTQTLAGFNCMDVCLLHTVVREGTTLRYVDATQQNVDANRKHRRMLLETEGLRRMRGGSVLSGVAAARTIRVSAGGFYYGLAQVLHDAFDTSGASTFTTVYANGSGGWTYTPAQTQIDNTKYDDGSGTLANLTGTRYGVHWVYLALGTPCELVVQYGTGNYSGMPGALEAAVPTPPPLLQSLGVLLGRIIIRRNATELAAVDTAFDTTFTFTRLTDHEELSGLQGGDVGEHYHLTAAQHGGLPATAAPQDGKLYGMKNGQWVEITGGGGGGSMSITTSKATFVAETTNAATATTEGTMDVKAKYGGIITMRITNGATGPTVPCRGFVFVSHEDTLPAAGAASWRAIWMFSGVTTASASVTQAFTFGPEVRHIKTTFTGNTEQAVTVEALASLYEVN